MKKNGSQKGSSKSPNVSGQNSHAGSSAGPGGRRRRRADQVQPRQRTSIMTTRKENSIMSELTYDQAAEMFHVSPRHMRRLCRIHNIKPIVRGHRTVRLPADPIAKLHIKLVLSKNGGAR
jgi:AraC-like DNA-binding protein